MSTEVCPTCEGLCCREGSEMHSMHRVRVYTKHVCPDCDAGLVWATHTEPASRPARTAEDERAAIVTWLRWRASDASPTAEAALLDVADEIDRGEHRRDKP